MRDFDSTSVHRSLIALVLAAVVWAGAGGTARSAQQTAPEKPKSAQVVKTATAAAPAPAPAGSSVLLGVTRVHPGSWEDYVALQKAEGMPALQKGGRAARQAWRTQGLGRSYEVAYLYPVKSWAELDDTPPLRKALGADGEKAFYAKLRPMLEESRTYALRSRPELGFVADESFKPKLGILAHVQVIPGKQAAFEALLKNEWAPAIRKAGVPLYGVYEVMLGGNMGEYYTFTPIDNFAAIDAGHPILRSLGQAQYNLLVAKVGALVSQVERSVTKLDEDLSFGQQQ
jgi:hypothetical protein